jgi:hypothetical protein
MSFGKNIFIVYLECPSQMSFRYGMGYRLHGPTWAPGPVRGIEHLMTSYRDVQINLYREIVVRLSILKALLVLHKQNFTPLHWLLFLLSSGGGQIVKITMLAVRTSVFTCHDIEKLLLEISLMADHYPVLFFDEVQLLADRELPVQIAGVEHYRSLFWCVMKAVEGLTIAAIWCGTQMEVEQTELMATAVAKNEFVRGLRVLGNFTYLEPSDVANKLNDLLNLRLVSPDVIDQVAYLLQGRPRLCTEFISQVVTSKGLTWDNTKDPVLHVREIDDEFLLEELSSFIEDKVIARLNTELRHLSRLKGASAMSVDDIGDLWCNCVLHSYRNTNVEIPRRTNSLAFTENVEEVRPSHDPVHDELIDESSPELKVGFRFHYRYGEPALLEMLLRYVTTHRQVADNAITAFLQGAIGASALGQYLEFAVIMAFLSRQSTIMQSLCSQNRYSSSKFHGYNLNLSRVVTISSSEHLTEWITKLLANPNDRTFSLLRGVPVASIILSPPNASGADCICAALLEQNVVDCTAPSTPGVVNRAFQVRSPIVMCSSDVTAIKKAALPTSTSSSATTVLEEANHSVLVITVASACSSKSVPLSKHSDQLFKVDINNQFSTDDSSGDSQFRNQLRKHKDRIQNLKVLVEFPKCSDASVSLESDYVLICENNGNVLFPQQLVESLMERKIQSRI